MAATSMQPLPGKRIAEKATWQASRRSLSDRSGFSFITVVSRSFADAVASYRKSLSRAEGISRWQFTAADRRNDDGSGEKMIAVNRVTGGEGRSYAQLSAVDGG
jgi:hypothetical protein